MKDREALIYLLQNESAISASLAVRGDSKPAVYYGQIPKTESGKPCIVILRDATTEEATVIKNSAYTLNVYGNSLSEAEDLSRTIFNTLNASKGDASGFAFGKIIVDELGSFTDIENYFSVLSLNFQFRRHQEN
jgi:hypothetical protein